MSGASLGKARLTQRLAVWIALSFVLIGSSATAEKAPTGLSAERILHSSGASLVRVSPTGDWVAADLYRGRLNGIAVQRIGSGSQQVVLTTEDSVQSIHWTGENEFIASFSTDTGSQWFSIVLSAAGGLGHSITKLDTIGWLVDPLPLSPGEVVWSFQYREWTHLHRVSLIDLAGFRKASRNSRGRFRIPGDQIEKLRGAARDWVVDAELNVRAVTMIEEELYRVLVSSKPGAGLRTIRRIDYSDDEATFRPLAATADGTRLIVAAYGGRDKIGLELYDPVSDQFTETLFRRPDVDITGLQVDDLTREPVAAIYEVGGEVQYDYFGGEGRASLVALQEQFGDQSLSMVSRTEDGKRFALWVRSATNPGEYFFRDETSDQLMTIATVADALDRSTLSRVEEFVVESKDGTEIEAYLTIPNHITRDAFPLVVMPHGGPINIRDRRVFNARVQYLASWGYAVLQPNYRGSAGYGRDFIEAAKKQWASGIEDDIDAAVEHVMKRADIDASRVCIIGGSYGGFSALANVVRHRDRYRCAISWNGVSDIAMLAESSDMADSEDAMEYFDEFIGDLETEREKLIAASPAYSVEKIETPIMFIYGDRDRRVDPDHSHRMMLMLETLDKPFESLEIEGMAHGYNRTEGIIILRAMRRYLSRFLYADSEFERDPEFSEDADASQRVPIKFDR